MEALLALPCDKIASRKTRHLIVCRDGSRGFNPKKEAKGSSSIPDSRKRLEKISGDDVEFEKRLQELRASGLEQKKMKEEKQYGPIEYKSSTSTDTDKKDNLLLKVGAGLAVLGLVVSFTIGDYLPTTRSSKPDRSPPEAVKTISPEEGSKLKAELEKYEEALKANPEEPTALEGAGVIYAELGQYKDAEANLEKLTKINSEDKEAWRLLAEVKSASKDYEGSIAAYRGAMKASGTDSMVLLRGLTQALIDAKKPDVAVEELLSIKEKFRSSLQVKITTSDVKDNPETETDKLDPLQIDLLLAKSYSAWNRSVDALAVYDGLVKSFPDDFRGYLAKGVLLKEQGRTSEAERMFIQARYLAPSKAKFLVDKFSSK